LYRILESLQNFHYTVTMVRKLLLPSVVAIGVCCLPAASFTPDTLNLHHVRLDRLVEVVSAPPSSSSSSSSSPILVQVAPLEEQQLDTDDDALGEVRGLPPVLQQITDERRNFQRNLGKAMDTLRKDMPYILKTQPKRP
jgi:hypothetical protein